MDNKHSPLPWAFKSTADKSKFSAQWREIFDASGRSITQPTDYQKSFETFSGEREEVTVSGVFITEANAEYITTACNAYPELVAALTELATFVDSIPYGRPYAGRPHQIMDKARALLSKLQNKH